MAAEASPGRRRFYPFTAAELRELLAGLETRREHPGYVDQRVLEQLLVEVENELGWRPHP